MNAWSQAVVVARGRDRHRPRDEPYGRIAVFRDIAGNRWDLIGPASA